MALDEQSAALLQALSSLAPQPLEQLTILEAREFADNFPVLGSEPLAAVEDIGVALPSRTLRIRLYRPSQRRLPVVVFFHGGGWTLSSVESYDQVCRQLAKHSGCVIAALDYRLAPEHKFPAAVDDGTDAIAWLVANGEDLDLDVSRIAVAGDSAGGNLATAVALRDSNVPDRRISFQALIYPVTEYEFGRPSMRSDWSGYPLSADTVKWFWSHYLSSHADTLNPLAAPITAPDLSRMPPTLVITAEDDPVRDQGEAYARRLRSHGVQVKLSRYGGVFHGFFQMLGMHDKASRAIEETGSALRLVLAAPDSEADPRL
jgi:acetyl esterase